MIKILVDNEEVISNNNLQINEEMLSTSSTILKNCYPKSWEENKDYTSQYYFPKDYSKCLIYDKYEDEEPGTTIKGNNLSINYDENKLWDYKVYGNSNGLTGLQKITVNNNDYEFNLGKNLFNLNENHVTGNMSGSGVVSESEISTFELSSTGFSIGDSSSWKGVIYDNVYLESGKTYTISLEANSNAFFLANYYYNENDEFISTTTLLNNTSNRQYTFTVPNNVTYTKIVFECRNANSVIQFSNIQIEIGNQKTEYAPFFTPIVLGVNDYLYKTDTWYYSLNGNIYNTSSELTQQLNNVELVNGNNEISITNGEIEIHYNYTNVVSNLIFCGCVKNTGNISLNPRQPHFVDLQVLDFKTLLSEGETLDYVISNKTIVEAINQVVASISDYGFVVGNIEVLNPDDVINAYSTLNKTPYDVFQYIADITQSRWSTRMIDENTIAIDFYDPTLMPKASDINHTKEYFEENKIDSIDFNYSTNDYRNKQIMTSDEVYANITQTETVIANGYQDSFMCQNKIGQITEITINGVSATFITKNEKELGLNGDFVYNPGEMTFTSNNILNAGDVIVIIYYPIVKGREIILNSNEVSRINNQINRKGTISRYENRKDATSSQELQKIGQSYIKYKGNAEITLKIVSENDLFNIGQIVSYNAPLEELTTDYMVKKKTIDMYLNADKIFYTFELSSNFNYENAVNYFDNQRAKNQGNIGEGDVINRNIDLESTALIQFYDTNVEEIQIAETTSLDFGLDGVLI